MAEGVDGLLRDKIRPPGIARLKAELVEKVVTLTLERPAHEATHWTVRVMAKAVGIAASSVVKIWHDHGLAPHRWRSFKLSNDKTFAKKLHDVVGLSVSLPAHAIVLSVDERSQIQALDRTQPGLPLKRGRGATMTHDYKRNGTTTLFAALNVLDGSVIGVTCSATAIGSLSGASMPSKLSCPPRQGRPCHPRQLCHPQATRCARLARPASLVDGPLRSNVLLMAQCSRGVLRQTHPAAPQKWRVPLRRRPPGRHQPLHQRAQSGPASVRMEGRPEQIIAAVRRGHQTLESIH